MTTTAEYTRRTIGLWIRRLRGPSLLIASSMVAAGLLGIQSDLDATLFVRASFAATAAQDRSAFYCLKVKLAYKSEQQDFDIVIDCNVPH
jgi:hypothetical protein